MKWIYDHSVMADISPFPRLRTGSEFNNTNVQRPISDPGTLRYSNTWATLLEGPLVVPATASMFVQYPSRTHSQISRANKPLPPLPKPVEDDQDDETSIAEMYGAYQPLLRSSSPIPSRRQRSSKVSKRFHHQASYNDLGLSHNIRRLPSWRPSIFRGKCVTRSVRRRVVGESHGKPSSRPSPLHQHVQVSQDFEPSQVPHTEPKRPADHSKHTSSQRLFSHPSSLLPGPWRQRQREHWESLKSNVRKALKPGNVSWRQREEGWQIMEEPSQLKNGRALREEGADRFGKMGFMVWSSKP